jgi:hypothetical protein
MPVSDDAGRDFFSYARREPLTEFTADYGSTPYASNRGGRLVFVSANPDLQSEIGHYRLYEERMRLTANRAGYPYISLASKKWAASENIIPAFSQPSGFYALAQRAAREQPVEAIRLFQTEVSEALATWKGPIENPIFVVFVYCGSARQAVELARQRPIDNIVYVVNGFYNYLDPRVDETFATLGAIKFVPHVEYLACSFVEQTMIDKGAGLHFESIPNPWPLADDFASADRLVRSAFLPKDGGDLKILFPALGSDGKGGQAVDRFIGWLIGETLPNTTFVFRDSNGDLKKKHGNHFGKRKDVTFIEGFIEDEPWLKYFDAAHIAVIPYEADMFSFRTSGVLVDCLLSGVVPIVRRGTWLASVCEALDVGIVTNNMSTAEIQRAIRLFNNDRKRYRSRLPAAAMAYLSQNSWNQLINCCISPVLSTLPEQPIAVRVKSKESTKPEQKEKVETGSKSGSAAAQPKLGAPVHPENTTSCEVKETDSAIIARATGPADGGNFFGFRLTNFVGCAAGQTLRLQIELTVTDHKTLKNVYLCLREWVPDGPFSFQTVALLQTSEKSQQVSVYLTARNAGMVYEGSLLAEAKGQDAAIGLKIKSVTLALL